MKLLLTSAGITNKSIAKALGQLAGRTPAKTRVAFIPTAANVEAGEKSWFITQLTDLQKFGYEWIDVVDPSADGVSWQERLQQAHAIFVSGGNTFHLLDQYHRTGFGKWLTKNLGDKVYVGVSAGSIIAAPSIDVATIPPADHNLPNMEDLRGMKWVDFEVEPHCDTKRFATIEYYSQTRNNTVYAIDDQSAIAVAGDKVSVVSEGKWQRYN